MKYLGLIEYDGNAWGGTVPDLERVNVGGKSRHQVLWLLEEALALHLHELESRGQAIPAPVAQSLEDLSAEYLQDFADSSIEGVLLSTVPINPLSLKIQSLLDESGLSESEVARRMGTSLAALSHLKKPINWSHNDEVFRRFMAVMGVSFEVGYR